MSDIIILMKYDVKKAIELGKIWMKNSVNVGHDYEHATNCWKHAYEIAKEIPVDMDSLELAVWWHDAYKARTKSERVTDLLKEGRCSRRIFEREVSEYLSPAQLKEVGKAIESHCSIVRSVLKHSNLTQILIESDQIEVMNKERNDEYYKHQTNIPLLIVSHLADSLNPPFLSYFAKSKYTRKILLKRKEKK